MSAWVEHCKKYAKENGCSYKDAMKLARPSYQCKEQTGGKLVGKNAVRKAKNTVKKSSKILGKVAPALSVIDPELGATATVVSKVGKKITGGGKKKLGSKKNPYLSGGSFRVASESLGGSFRVASEQYGGCMNCKKLKPGHTESSILAPEHPAFHPLKSKSYSRSIVEN